MQEDHNYGLMSSTVMQCNIPKNISNWLLHRKSIILVSKQNTLINQRKTPMRFAYISQELVLHMAHLYSKKRECICIIYISYTRRCTYRYMQIFQLRFSSARDILFNLKLLTPQHAETFITAIFQIKYHFRFFLKIQ